MNSGFKLASVLAAVLLVVAVLIAAALATAWVWGPAPELHLVIDGESVDFATGGHGLGVGAVILFAVVVALVCVIGAFALLVAPMLLIAGLALLLAIVAGAVLVFGAVLLVPLLPLVLIGAVVWLIRRRRRPASIATAVTIQP
jgi:hypothetical protein